MNFKDLHLHWGGYSYKEKKYRSYSLARSVWINGTSRKQIVVKLGKLSDDQVAFWKEILVNAKKSYASSNENPQNHDPNYQIAEPIKLTNTGMEINTENSYVFEVRDKQSEVTKLNYTESDQSIDVHAYEEAVKQAFQDVDDPRVKRNR